MGHFGLEVPDPDFGKFAFGQIADEPVQIGRVPTPAYTRRQLDRKGGTVPVANGNHLARMEAGRATLAGLTHSGKLLMLIGIHTALLRGNGT